MSFESNDFYTGDAYVQNNPLWNDDDSAWKAGQIDSLLKANGISPQSVIEVGCGAGGILHKLEELQPGIDWLKGFDISPHAILLASKRETAKLKFYETDFLTHPIKRSQLLLIIDVIEHVDDFYGFLNKIGAWSEYFVFHIPLDLSVRNLLKPHTIKIGRTKIGHIHYFTKDTAEWALHDTGFEIIDFVYTKPMTDTRPAKNFKQLVKKTLRNISFSLMKSWSVRMWGGYSILVLAKKRELY